MLISWMDFTESRDTEDGFIYVDGLWFTFIFEGRFHRSTTPHTTSVCKHLRIAYDGTNPGYHQYAYDDGIDGSFFNVIECGYRVGKRFKECFK
jgi:hypothetical protein